MNAHQNAASMAAMHESALPETLAAPPPPYAAQWLGLGEGHRMYYEQGGSAEGIPVVFLHGGPGSGCSPRHRQLFDTERYRVTLFDQRGCGRSQPRGALHANTSDHLVADIEQLRQHLGVDRWLVFGGSWGAGLALAYAAAHPSSCLGLVLRGAFLGRSQDLNWFFQQAQSFLPDAWDALARQAPPGQRADLLRWLQEGLHGGVPPEALARALAWESWEEAVSQRRGGAPQPPRSASDADAALVDKYRVQSHYLGNGCFWGDAPLLERARSLASMPTAILHGRLDWVCLPQAAWELHQALPGSRLQWLDDCGHSPFEPPMAQALAQALEYFANHGNFAGWGQSAP
jgi:proline iminopeptidase